MKSLIILLIVLSNYSLANSYFPKDYKSSKKRFYDKSNELSKDYRDVVQGAIVVGKEKLTINYTYIPGQQNQKKLVIISSGNHGPESYAGAALQHQFMDKTLKTLDQKETGVLLIHALNPWGFKHHRRGTENNVNLNRNYALTKQIFSTPNDGYKKLKPLLERRVPIEKFEYPFISLLKKMLFESGVTQQSLTEAIGRGQYISKGGINFGGFDFETQTIDVIELLKKIVPLYSEIFHIDLHTGLGDKGVLHIMTPPKMNNSSLKRLDEIFQSKKDEDNYEITPPGAKGFYEILGDYKNIVSKVHPDKSAIIVGITAEFGTVGRGLIGKLKTVNRLILENQGHFAGYGNKDVKNEIQNDYLELFYPSDPSWRKDVLRKGHFLLDTIVKRFIKK